MTLCTQFLLTNHFAISAVIKHYAEDTRRPKAEGFLLNKILLSDCNVHSCHSYEFAYADPFIQFCIKCRTYHRVCFRDPEL